VAGALWGFVHLGSWEPAAFNIDRSFQLLFMVIIGGLGSIMGSFFGAAFIVLLPIFLEPVPAGTGRWASRSTPRWSHAELMIFGALIVFFLIVEPHGLARLWSIGQGKAAPVALPALKRDPPCDKKPMEETASPCAGCWPPPCRRRWPTPRRPGQGAVLPGAGPTAPAPTPQRHALGQRLCGLPEAGQRPRAASTA
jgi:hypothetical protein